MAIYAKTDKDLKRLNRIAKKRSSKGLVVDPIQYSGDRGRYTMVYNGEEYVPEFTVRDMSQVIGFDVSSIEEMLGINKEE